MKDDFEIMTILKVNAAHTSNVSRVMCITYSKRVVYAVMKDR